MSKTAFPLNYTEQDRFGNDFPNHEFGISQRLYIATKIAAGLSSNTRLKATNRSLAATSFAIADELIKKDEL